MADRNVMVLIDKDATSLEAVAKNAERLGLNVGQIMRGMRTIVGTVRDGEAIERIRGLDGVKSIREDGEVRLPRMDPSIPQ